jgi:hypothetical protein
MADNCARCGQKVKSEENWMRAHLWASNAVFHWVCFIALMKEHGEQGAEAAAWKGSRDTTDRGDPKRNNHD